MALKKEYLQHYLQVQYTGNNRQYNETSKSHITKRIKIEYFLLRNLKRMIFRISSNIFN